MNRWPILRYLLSSHTVVLVGFLLGVYLLVAVIVAVAAMFTEVTVSGVDIAGQVLPWLAAGYGYSAAALLSTVLTHGRTRREFLAQHPVFLLVTAGLLAVVATGAYAVEAVVYRAAGWTRTFQDQRVFEAGDYPLILLAYVSMLAVWMMTGALLGGAFYRDEGGGLLALLPAAVLLSVSGGANGFLSLPFTRWGLTSAPEVAVVTVVAVAAGWALLWAALRDVPLRTRVAS
ncbi:hypothetical protein FHR83_006221 [Actinoplanes campanulatus]|uniref:ABC-2 type transport system permease protein n=1 Tax=Actinoplanes campanulatus TaxID=113559 RepID=A0A7W5ALM2_9ACTN|nr:hypothetical protein [Actinoplanes campanulatus]MBB3098522.1 hypothetical protein [Actinoplanes campanulatus]GGN35699.1 hypothetical protein GCM10010109_59930 [Actinoplanes campanulatus]GID39216.1 hypothetical protein Aca09nite_57220 [Actinoplanes campanulatus]